MGRASPKFKQKFNRPGKNMPVWRNQIYLPCRAIGSESSNTSIFHSKLTSKFQTRNVVNYPFLKESSSFPNLQGEK